MIMLGSYVSRRNYITYKFSLSYLICPNYRIVSAVLYRPPPPFFLICLFLSAVYGTGSIECLCLAV